MRELVKRVLVLEPLKATSSTFQFHELCPGVQGCGGTVRASTVKLALVPRTGPRSTVLCVITGTSGHPAEVRIGDTSCQNVTLRLRGRAQWKEWLRVGDIVQISDVQAGSDCMYTSSASSRIMLVYRRHRSVLGMRNLCIY